jgi:hypothetical protein
MFLKNVFLKKYYTMDKVQKHDSSKCTTPLSEPFRIDFLVDLGLSMAQAVSRRPLTAGLGVCAQVRVGFMVDKVALG